MDLRELHNKLVKALRATKQAPFIAKSPCIEATADRAVDLLDELITSNDRAHTLIDQQETTIAELQRRIDSLQTYVTEDIHHESGRPGLRRVRRSKEKGH